MEGLAEIDYLSAAITLLVMEAKLVESNVIYVSLVNHTPCADLLVPLALDCP